MKIWKPRICIGWFKGNPLSGFELKLFTPIEGYPEGIDGIELFGIRFLLFEFGIWMNKPGV